MASCAAAAQPQEQQLPEGTYLQAQQQLQQEQAASASHTLQSVAARVAMLNAMSIPMVDKSRQGVQQPDGPKPEGVSSRHRHQQWLLVLLTRCAEMERLLAHLLPGFLALNADEAQQVSGTLSCPAAHNAVDCVILPLHVVDYVSYREQRQRP